MLNFIKKNKGPIFTFIVSILVTLTTLKLVGILDGTILISDLNAEYQPLLMQVNKMLTGKVGLYNLNTGLGDNFIGTFYYYVSSPLNILTIFIKDINFLVIILVTLKLSLTSLFSYFFFKYQFKEEKIKYLCIFSLLYSLSSFSLAYYFHIMWLDVYMLFPLLLLGIDKIIKEKKHLLYIISLFLIIFCNYYFAYMICIFSFIYFNYKLLLDKISLKKLLKENIHFIIISILTCLIASITLIPVASELKTYSRQNGQLFGGDKLKFNFSFYSLVKYYLLGDINEIGILNDDHFLIYTSIIVFPLLYFYFINKEIKLREKILSSVILLLLILSMCCNYLNYMWHGFVPPSFFNGRYTFMFILFILMLCIKSIYYLKDYKMYHYFIIIVSFLGLLIIPKNIKYELLDITKIIIFFMYIIILYLINNEKCMDKVLLVLITIEVILNGFNYLNRYNFSASTGNENFKKCINYIKENDNSVFYRIEDNNSASDNYPMLYNYYGMDYFMSTVKTDLINFFIDLDVGNHGYTKNTLSYDGSFYLISSLLNTKYYLETKYTQYNFYEKIEEIDEYTIYKNNNYLNLGYMVNKDILDTKLDSNGLDNINKIYKSMTGKSVLKEIKLEQNNEDEYTFNNLKYSFKNKDNKNFYVLVKLKNWYSYSDLSVSINDMYLSNDNNTFNYFINNIYEKDSNINIDINANNGTIEDIVGVYAYYIDDEEYSNAIDILRNNQLEITKIKNNKIEGKINVEDNDILFTSIPYSNDLDIYVDGKKVEKVKLLNTFIGAKIDKGNHKIEIKYTPKILYISFIPSIGGLLLLFGYIKLYKKKLAKN